MLDFVLNGPLLYRVAVINTYEKQQENTSNGSLCVVILQIVGIQGTPSSFSFGPKLTK